MKTGITIFLFLICAGLTASGQYYFRGEVRDQNNQPLPFVRIYIHSTGSFYYSGSTGAFGIPSTVLTDSATFKLAGYDEKTVLLHANEFTVVQLVVNAGRIVRQQGQLLSVVRNLEQKQELWNTTTGETYSQLLENEFADATVYPGTSFALNVDKASYSNIRRFINMGSMVPVDAVRIEEMLNYFPQQVQVPEGKNFLFNSRVTGCPWDTSHQLLLLQMHARKVNFDHLPPSHLVFLIDVSGSMEFTNRLPLLKTAFRLLVENLRPVDTISIITYGGSVVVALPPTSGIQKDTILSVIESLQPGGETPGEHALQAAYELARVRYIKGGNNRIILATDGDFNVGLITEEALMELVANKQQMGIYLTCLGVGVGNYKDSRLEAMARKGNGNFAYIDHVHEAEKVLVKELMQTLFAIANNAHLDVYFNPRFVKRYRLIGYDNHKNAQADPTNEIEGGEIGSGHTVTALFEIEPFHAVIPADSILAAAELNYQLVNSGLKTREEFTCIYNYVPFNQADSLFRFLASVAEFGMILRNSKFLNHTGWLHLLEQLKTCINPYDYWQNEFLEIVQKAKEIYLPDKKKKKPLQRKKQ
jgi:Ca-activated chloride channel family protein